MRSAYVNRVTLRLGRWRMLAHPLARPAASFSNQKDVDESRSFFISRGNGISSIEQLLASPVQFVEGSSSGAFAVPEGKYEPINTIKPAPSLQRSTFPNPDPSSTTGGIPGEVQKGQTRDECIYSDPIQYHYPPALGTRVGTGLVNVGNTCFLNSVLQALVHLPPLMNVLSAHKCLTSHCTICSLRQVMEQLYSSKKHFIPSTILGSLNSIAKHFRKNRQEDAHEFLRYLIEALQKSCISHLPTPVDHKLAETTWVHHIFGGRLRSRVKCRECGHPSDTFDSMLDLSIDVHGMRSLKEALHKFVKLDVLKGADCYKCEKCKRPVIAEKGFTIHKAPPVLTVHLKRFTPMGRKLANPVRYDDVLEMQPYMSEGKFGPAYRLFGVINHAGSGPNSGHYYAFVRSRSGKWHEMNDDSVEPLNGASSNKSAYILFYVQQQGEKLREATKRPGTSMPQDREAMNVTPSDPLSDAEREDVGVPAATFVMPRSDDSLPIPPPSSSSFVISPLRQHSTSATQQIDPQADMLKRRISSFESRTISATSKSPVESLKVSAKMDTEVEKGPPILQNSPMLLDKGEQDANNVPSVLSMSSAIDSNTVLKRKQHGHGISGSSEKRQRTSTTFVANPFSGRGNWQDTLKPGATLPKNRSSVACSPSKKNRMNKRSMI